MKANNQYILIDSGFWIAFYEPEKEPQKHMIASGILEIINDSFICIPWPTMYEFINSRFSRRDENIRHFESLLKRQNIIKIYDDPYRKQAMENLFSPQNFGDRSLVDEVIKMIISDVALNIKYLVSFDEVLCNAAASKGINISLSRF